MLLLLLHLLISFTEPGHQPCVNKSQLIFFKSLARVSKLYLLLYFLFIYVINLYRYFKEDSILEYVEKYVQIYLLVKMKWKHGGLFKSK